VEETWALNCERLELAVPELQAQRDEAVRLLNGANRQVLQLLQDRLRLTKENELLAFDVTAANARADGYRDGLDEAWTTWEVVGVSGVSAGAGAVVGVVVWELVKLLLRGGPVL
jgi:hypothetical protein